MPRGNKEKTRERILEAAIQVFEERGFGAASVDQIAQRAGVAKGTVYLHFPSKEALFVEALKHAYHQLEGAIRGELPRVVDPCARARRAVEISVEYVSKYKNLIRAAVHEANLSPGAGRELLEARLRFVMEMAETIRKGVEEGVYRPCDPVVMVLSLLGAVQNAVFFWAVVRGRDPHEITEELVRMVWRMLGCPEEGA